LGELHQLEFFLPGHLQKDYPSHIHIDLMERAQGQGIGVRMIKTILATLKAKGAWYRISSVVKYIKDTRKQVASAIVLNKGKCSSHILYFLWLSV